MKKNIKRHLVHLLIFPAFILILSVVVSCKWKWNNKSFFIDSLDLHVDVEIIDSIETELAGTPLRIYIYNEECHKGLDYIDIVNDMTEMPSIMLCIPNHHLDTIYIIDNWHEVRHLHSDKIKFIHLEQEKVENGELITIEKYNKINRIDDIMDSVLHKIPSTSIQLNSGFIDLSIWENNEYIGKINSNETE